MKRKIEVTTPNMKIVATFNTGGELTSGETKLVRDELADRLMQLAADARWVGCPLNRVKVK